MQDNTTQKLTSLDPSSHMQSFDIASKVKDLKEQLKHCDDPYIKCTLEADEQKEIILTCWRPNCGSHIHNHGKSCGKILVVEGGIIEEVYKYCPQEKMTSLSKQVFKPNETLEVTPVNFHSMASIDQETTTLHVYSPGIDNMMVYNNDTQKLESVDGSEVAQCT